MKGPGYS